MDRDERLEKHRLAEKIITDAYLFTVEKTDMDMAHTALTHMLAKIIVGSGDVKKSRMAFLIVLDGFIDLIQGGTAMTVDQMQEKLDKLMKKKK